MYICIHTYIELYKTPLHRDQDVDKRNASQLRQDIQKQKLTRRVRARPNCDIVTFENVTKCHSFSNLWYKDTFSFHVWIWLGTTLRQGIPNKNSPDEFALDPSDLGAKGTRSNVWRHPFPMQRPMPAPQNPLARLGSMERTGVGFLRRRICMG